MLCFKMMKHGPLASVQSQQSWLFNQWRTNNFSATFFCGTEARMMFFVHQASKTQRCNGTGWEPGEHSQYMTQCRLDGTGIKSRWGQEFPQPSRLALGPTQPPVQWVLGLYQVYSGQRIVLTSHPPSNDEVKEKSIAIPPLPMWAFTAHSGVNFTPFLLIIKDKKCRFRIYVLICYKAWKETEYRNNICSHKWNIRFHLIGHEKWFSSSFLWPHFQLNIFDITYSQSPCCTYVHSRLQSLVNI